jgi:hypothetical protein
MNITKKIFAILLAGLLTLSLAACGDKKEDEENDKESSVIEQNYIEEASNKGKFEYALNVEGDYELIKYEPYDVTANDITLPKEVNGRDIVGIAANAFTEAASSIKSVTVPDTYKYIGDYAFYDCDSLVSIKLPATLEQIGVSAFRSCDILADFTMPAGVKVVSEYAFMDCKAIKALDLSSVTEINKGAFLNCAALEGITLSDKLEYATKEAFYGCDALVYNEEAELKYLGNDANKTILLVSPKSLNVTECAVSASTKVIADSAFNACEYLTKITLSDSVKVINGTSFTGCTELKLNKVENGLYLGTEANPYMVLIELDIHTVEDFKLNKDTKIIAKTAFAKCTLLEDISFEGAEADWQAIIKPADWNGDLTVNVTCSDKMITVLG